MFEKITEKKIIKQIRKEMKRTDLLKYLSLNMIKSSSADLLIHGKLSMDFYGKVFCGGDLNNHWSEVNKDYIEQYR